jgi:hypothetical protein
MGACIDVSYRVPAVAEQPKHLLLLHEQPPPALPRPLRELRALHLPRTSECRALSDMIGVHVVRRDENSRPACRRCLSLPCSRTELNNLLHDR